MSLSVWGNLPMGRANSGALCLPSSFWVGRPAAHPGSVHLRACNRFWDGWGGWAQYISVLFSANGFKEDIIKAVMGAIPKKIFGLPCQGLAEAWTPRFYQVLDKKSSKLSRLTENCITSSTFSPHLPIIGPVSKVFCGRLRFGPPRSAKSRCVQRSLPGDLRSHICKWFI